ncbi:peptidase domain-containing ABC transporter [Porphyrobacter sp. YT40]|uniref:peptidase domain-containing ABC transporter n=1 Tax=Porphyrobacter sp. YT40 TaxID=2547601 RepID=UPI0015E8A08B|nr:peptidase domain-containing ABC transporter [Porphyrobacter sp. YT40]
MSAPLSTSGHSVVADPARTTESAVHSLWLAARYHGIEISLNSLREQAAMSRSELGLAQLVTLGERIGLSGRIVTLGESVDRAAAPLIVRLPDGRIGFGGAESTKSLRLDVAGHPRSLSIPRPVPLKGIVFEPMPRLNAAQEEEERPARLRELWPGIQGFWQAAGQILVISVALLVITFAFPFFTQLVIDEAIAKGDTSLLLILAIGFGTLAALRFALDLTRSWALAEIGQSVAYQTMGRLVARLIRIRQDFLNRQSVGDLLSRMQSGRSLQEILTKTMVESLLDGVMAIFAIVLLFFYSAPLTLIVLVGLAIDTMIGMAFLSPMRDYTQRDLINRGVEQSHLIETMRATTTVKLLGGEMTREGEWRQRYLQVAASSLGLAKCMGLLAALQRLSGSIQMIVLVAVGASIAIEGEGLSVGMLVAFLSFRSTFSERALALINQAMQLRFLKLHLRRLAPLVHQPTELGSEAPATVGQETIALRDVCFTYGEGAEPVLRNLDLTVPFGEYIAITGRSGGGKSTLLKLLTGLYEPAAGTIMIGSRPANPALWHGWRGRAGIVLQDDQLFSGSIAENIAFFDPEMSVDRVVEAARSANIIAEIEQMSQGFSTMIGEMGAALSGGHRQPRRGLGDEDRRASAQFAHHADCDCASTGAAGGRRSHL